jgi:hypothetical protein
MRRLYTTRLYVKPSTDLMTSVQSLRPIRLSEPQARDGGQVYGLRQIYLTGKIIRI